MSVITGRRLNYFYGKLCGLFAAKGQATGGDFNGITGNGIYTVAEPLNPPGAGEGGYMLIAAAESGYSGGIWQIAIDNGSRLKVRHGSHTGDKVDFSPWRAVHTGGDEGTKMDIVDTIYPVGSIYMGTSPTNPGELFGGTWESWGAGRVPVGVDVSQEEFRAVEKEGGEKGCRLASGQLPPHSHTVAQQEVVTGSAGEHTHQITFTQDAALGGGGVRVVGGGANSSSSPVKDSGSHNHTFTIPEHSTGSTGNGEAHNNLQPYITCYMWKRTA